MFSNAISLFLLLLLNSYTKYVHCAYFQGCDHTYNLNAGTSYLESPYYPQKYPANTSCRYKFIAPLDYQITINCTIEMPKSNDGCSSEYFYIARDGDVDLRGSEQVCGYGRIVRTSLFRSITLAYISYGQTGRFQCQLITSPQPCDCGWSVNTRIVNGKQASLNEYPSMVALIDVAQRTSFCAGSIITHRYILTAAHCTQIQSDPSKIIALVGYQDLENSASSIYSANYEIIEIIEHKGYSFKTGENDIALLKTFKNIEWSRGVGPICLPPISYASTTFAYSKVDVIGWGSIYFAGPRASTLQKITLMVTDKPTCQDAYKGVAIIKDSQICTYDYSGSGRDSCQYDSGGPVIYRSMRQFLLGCISFGKACGEGSYPVGVNTRITSFLLWIQQYIGNTACAVSSM